MNYLKDIKPLENAGHDDASILAILNTKSVAKRHPQRWTRQAIKERVGAIRAADLRTKLDGIIDGSEPMPSQPDGSPVDEKIRTVVADEVDDLKRNGLDLSYQGTNDFLRLLGFGDVADLGIMYLSPWVVDGNTGSMAQSDLDEVRRVHNAEALNNQVASLFADNVSIAIDAVDRASVATALRFIADEVEA